MGIKKILLWDICIEVEKPYIHIYIYDNYYEDVLFSFYVRFSL